MKTQKHYDRISRFYELPVVGGEIFYAKPRRRAVRELRLSNGSVVLDIACGTGLNFPLLRQAVGPEGRIIGLDYSEGMLQRAARKIDANDWTNVSLIHDDARNLSQELLQPYLDERQLDAVICTLGLTVVPEWESVLDQSISLLGDGGRYVIMDDRKFEGAKGLLNPLVCLFFTLAASADCQREPWKRLESRVADFRMSHFMWGFNFVASGTKR
ncbi:MAG: methyltransferase domain-containing protein [Dehalococcoidia bacterium]